MNSPLGRCLTVLLAMSAMLLCTATAHASLGGDAATVVADADEVHGIANSEVRGQYEVRDIEGNGLHLREYLTRQGRVFAVAWTGLVMPNLERLLGTHFSAYSAAVAGLPTPGLHRSVHIASRELVVYSGGHLRAYGGRAYLPASVPVGVEPAELR